MEVLFASATDVGRERKINQDNYLVMEDKNFTALFDGMGGHSAGEIASSLAKETIKNIFNNTDLLNQNKLLEGLNFDCPVFTQNMVQAIRLANRRVFNLAVGEPNLSGMGTTVVAAWFQNNLACIAHVGDSRAYRIRDGKIEQLTNDHSWVNELIEDKVILPEEADNFQQRNVITRALGISGTVKVDVLVESVEESDYFILCSDGLHTLVEDDLILNTVLKYKQDLPGATESLIQTANETDGSDNITVTLVKVVKKDFQSENHSFVFRKIIEEENEKVTLLEDKLIKVLFAHRATTTISARLPLFSRLLNWLAK